MSCIFRFIAPIFRKPALPANDRALISETIEQARADWFAADEGIFDFLRDTLTMDSDQAGPPRCTARRGCGASPSRCSSSPAP
jgi:hypothetical protein